MQEYVLKEQIIMLLLVFLFTYLRSFEACRISKDLNEWEIKSQIVFWCYLISYSLEDQNKTAMVSYNAGTYKPARLG